MRSQAEIRLSGFGVERLLAIYRSWTFSGVRTGYSLRLIPQSLLVPIRPHALAALMLGDFCFPSFFE